MMRELFDNKQMSDKLKEHNKCTYRTQGITKWFDDYENYANHSQSPVTSEHLWESLKRCCSSSSKHQMREKYSPEK